MERIEFGISVLGILLVILVLAGCGGGDDGKAAAVGAGPELVTTTFSNGQVETTGTLDAQGRHQGEWKIYAADGQQLFEGHFINGEIDHSQPWTEWNPDGSVRYTREDGPHPSGGPW